MDLRSLLLPVVLVAIACGQYLKAVPTAGNDLLLDLVRGGTGAVLGVATALATRVWRAADGFAHSKAGVVGAVLWVLGVGSRFAYEEYVTHGGAPAIARFSVDHHITGTQAWVTAVLFMALAAVVPAADRRAAGAPGRLRDGPRRLPGGLRLDRDAA